MADGRLQIGWFSTGSGEGSRGLLNAALQAIDKGRLDADIAFVFCNRDRGQHEGTDQFLDIVDARGIPLVTLSSQGFRRANGNKPWSELRGDFDRAVMEKLAGFEAGISVAAGYMLLAPVLCRHYLIINLHPALPDGPIGTWQKVIWELIDERTSESGVMVNVTIPEMDAGPVISYCRHSLTGPPFDAEWARLGDMKSVELKKREGEEHPLFKTIREATLVRERPFLVETLRAVARGDIDPGHPSEAGPLDLTCDVEAALEAAG